MGWKDYHTGSGAVPDAAMSVMASKILITSFSAMAPAIHCLIINEPFLR